MRRSTGIVRRLRERVERAAQQNERGMVLAWFAIVLIVLLGFAGFAVDMSNWWLQAERVQRAADSGAHAGVVFLPGDLPSATSTARTAVERNGYQLSGSGQNATARVSQEPNPNRLRVKLTTEVDSYFVQLLGINSVTIEREAVAEYVAPVPMGSPENKLGNDPEGTDPGTNLWVNISGTQTGKQQGDRYQSRVCDGSPREVACTGAVNDEYAQEGYFFAMDVTAPDPSRPLIFQVYDAAFVNVGFTCADTNGMPTSQQIHGQSGFTALTSRFSDAATRYGSSRSGLSTSTTPRLATAQRFCSGDGHGSASFAAMDTTFIFREPDDTPWSQTDNPVINTATCRPTTVRGHRPTSARYVYDQLMSPTEGRIDPNDGVMTFAETFRRTTTFCTIPAGSVRAGKYIVQVRSNVRSTNPLVYDSTLTNAGHNKMSFRAGFGTAGVDQLDGSRVTIAALGKLPVFANLAATDTEFYMAKVMPYDAGRTLRISLFDMGESSDPATLQIRPPREFAEVFRGCAFSRSDGASATLTVDPSTCKLSNVHSSEYNGRAVTIDVPIPPNYDCDDDLPNGCWIKIRVGYQRSSTLNDATTWSAAILGNPVRLVE